MAKTIIITLIGVSLTLFLIVGGVVLLNKHIYSQQSCERFNIDNIELRTGINIPTITSSNCSCKKNHKVSTFVIDTLSVDLKEYIKKNRFSLVENNFINKGVRSDTKWKAHLDIKTAVLKVAIEYRVMRNG